MAELRIEVVTGPDDPINVVLQEVRKMSETLDLVKADLAAVKLNQERQNLVLGELVQKITELQAAGGASPADLQEIAAELEGIRDQGGASLAAVPAADLPPPAVE